MQVSSAHAAIDEDAVVVRARDAMLAHAAVLRPCGLEQLAGAAVRARVEHGKVVGILGHLLDVVVGRDVARVAGGREVEEDVGPEDGKDADGLLESGEVRPDAWEIDVLAANQQG